MEFILWMSVTCNSINCFKSHISSKLEPETTWSVDILESGLYMTLSLCPLSHQCVGTSGLRWIRKANRKPHPSFRKVPVWMTFSDLFKFTIIERQITWKWYDIQLYLQWLINRKLYVIYRTASFSITLNDPTFSFKVTPFFDAEYLRNGTTYRHNFNEILKGSYTRLMQQCHFEWPWVTLQNIQ